MNWWVLKRRVHTSWLIAMLCVGVIVGVIYAQYMPPSPLSWLYVGLVLAILGMWRHRVYVLPLFFIAGALIGLWRGGGSIQQLQPYAAIIGHKVVVRGTANDDPDLDKNNQLILQLSNVRINSHELAGSVWVSASKKLDIKRGDIVTVDGKLTDGFGNVSASMYRADVTKVERPVPGDVAGHVRDWFASGVRKAIPEPEASLGIGYDVGQRSALPTELDAALKTVGLTHIVVASGYNLTILVRLARRLFEKISKYLSTLAAGGMIVAFMAVTGLSPSMSRAGLVASLSLLAWYYGRKFHPLVLLPLAAAVTLFIRPSYGWNDLGWELSFAAFAGVMIVAPLLQQFFFGKEKPGVVRQILGETISAELVTLPILVLAFGQFSNVGLIANLLVLPLVPLAMLLTFIAGVGSLLIPSIIGIIGIPAFWLLNYMTSVARFLASLPWVQTSITINGGAVAVYYSILFAICIFKLYLTSFPNLL